MLVIRRALALWTGLLAVPGLAQTDRQLPLGETVEGALTAASDTLDDGRFVETYALTVSGETALEVALQSSEFDTYLIVVGPDDESVENDDWGGPTESRVAIEKGDRGHREVSVTSYSRGEIGSFTLSSRELDDETYGNVKRQVRADSLLALSHSLHAQGDYARSMDLLEEVLVIREGALGPDHPGVAGILDALGVILQAQGHFERALELQERALAIFEEALGPDHLEVAWSLTNIAAVVEDQGDFVRARALLERALAIREEALGPEHILVAEVLDALGLVLGAQGDFGRAEALHQRALAIRERELGPDHPEVADALNSLGVNLQAQGDFARARSHLERALAIWEGALGPDHPRVALSLNNLALVLQNLGDYESARELHERALAVWEEALGPQHTDVALALNNLATVLYAQGDFARSRTLHERALAIREGALGLDHPDVAQSLNNLATVLYAQGDSERARGHTLRVGQIRTTMVDRVFPTLSAAEQRAYVQVDLGAQTGAFLSSHRTGPSLEEAYANFGGWKGLLLRGLRRQAALAGLASDSTYAERTERLRALRTRVARAYHNGDPALSDLTAEKEVLERELLAALPDGEFRDPWGDRGLDGLHTALPADGVLVDIYRYGHRERGEFSEWRYAAVVTGPTAGPSLVDLGSAETIDEAVGGWRVAVTRGQDAAVETAALADAVWAPIGDALPEAADRVWVSPDGPLAGVPWATLAEVASGESQLVAQVPSARALLTLLTDSATPESAPTVLIVGGVAFGPGPDWDPLPATVTEADAVASLATSGGIAVSRLAGDAATVPAVASSLSSATYAHLATHGFVYAEPVPVREAREEALRSGSFGSRTPGSPGAGNWGRSPLALSGLALAGANTPDDALGGGALTAEELVGLDLSGTRLVALSACETGRGAQVAGQGVLGLQASLTAAGARAVLMSLWSVPDASTAALMTAFYRGLWAEGRSPADALRQAQAEVRTTEGWEAPLYWAGWVVSGDAFHN
ncbi:CHAT domain-containing tetratricopeptide repeat protein [Rubrivirga sp. IMCC43871]|uniref:CHAT domain-containing tetratricopeptide repeat protein n=1 Tax=Rubrivirga sp. IMCC43871 TaxID=3391575 RepID=UPI0039901F39